MLIYVAANVRRLREQHNFTQETLAEAVGLDFRQIQRIESGREAMSLATLVAVANALDVAPPDLLQPAEMPEIKRGRPRKEPAAAPEKPARKRTQKAPAAPGKARKAPAK